ncbi:MAG: hypothetical protein AAFQ02_00100 [Bacteroidota bacterium]
MQDPVSVRFVTCFNHLKDKGIVRSARQFALSIDTYPQSLNEILKGRRDVTIAILRSCIQEYQLNSEYLFTGYGRILKSEVEEDRQKGQIHSFGSLLAQQRASIDSLSMTIERLVSQGGQITSLSPEPQLPSKG